MAEPGRDAVEGVAGRLAAAGVPTPGVDARLLVRHVPADELDAAVTRRQAREPLQLILGRVGFRYLDLEVRAGVFIPRPETEVLAGEAVDRVPRGGIVLEPCTGTGAVAVSVATESAAGQVHASDVSPAAVALARANARAAAAGTVQVHEGGLLAAMPGALRGKVDVLVANPPYVAEHETRGLEPEVVDWDPPEALIAGPTGHEVSDRLIAGAGDWLAPGGWLLLEVAEVRAADVRDRAIAAGLTQAAVIVDLTGRERIVVARMPGRRGPQADPPGREAAGHGLGRRARD